jgi:hypothetical protein
VCSEVEEWGGGGVVQEGKVVKAVRIGLASGSGVTHARDSSSLVEAVRVGVASRTASLHARRDA